MSKYKVGDKVRIVGNKASHKFDNGDIVEIKEIDGGSYLGRNIDETFSAWWVTDGEIELVTSAKRIKKKKKKLTFEKILAKIDINDLSSIRIFSDYSGRFYYPTGDAVFHFEGLEDLNEKLDKLIKK